jgi:hypothetical protein
MMDLEPGAVLGSAGQNMYCAVVLHRVLLCHAAHSLGLHVVFLLPGTALIHQLGV